MMKIFAAAALAGTLFAPAVLACEGHEDAAQTAQKPAEPKAVNVDQLAAMMAESVKAKSALFIYDANTEKTRAEKGIIPTAVKLSSSTEYDLALLPKNKGDAAVFYCAAEKCAASKKAAKRAVEAGWTNVHVLPEGIAGWVKAGKPVEKPQA